MKQIISLLELLLACGKKVVVVSSRKKITKIDLQISLINFYPFGLTKDRITLISILNPIKIVYFPTLSGYRRKFVAYSWVGRFVCFKLSTFCELAIFIGIEKNYLEPILYDICRLRNV